MFCTKCGAKNDHNGKFCHSCGNPLNVIEVEKQTIPAPMVTNGSNESTYWENQSINNSVQQTPYQAQQVSNTVQPVPPLYNYQPGANGTGKQTAKKVKPFIIITPIIAVLAIIVLIVIIVSQSNKGILDNILSAVKGTIEADSFEFVAEAYTTDEDGRDGGKIDGTIECDLDKEILNFDIGMGDERTILYDGVIYELESGEVWDDENISLGLNMFYKYYSEYKDVLKGLSNIDWENAVDEVGIPLNFDAKVLQKCINQFEKNMNDTKYMESVCNKYEKKKTSEGTVYSFDVDVPEFVESLVETFDPIIDELNIASDLDYLYDELDAVDEFKIEIIIKNGKLVGLNAEISVNSEYGTETLNAELAVDNYGKAALNVDEIEGYIDDYNYGDSE